MGPEEPERALAVTREGRGLAVWVTACALALSVGSARADGPAKRKPSVVFDGQHAKHPSFRYGSLDKAACLAELTRRKVPFQKVAEAKGVLAPVRIPSGVDGVTYRTALPAAERLHSPFDVFDCRLVLALDDFSDILRAHGIDEVIMYSAWRPPPSGSPTGRALERHPGALAIDVKELHGPGVPAPAAGAPSGAKLLIDVQKQWTPALGRSPCGAGASPILPKTPEAQTLRQVVCEAVERHLFTSVLTPNYNRAHHNHVHLEVTPGVEWHLLK